MPSPTNLIDLTASSEESDFELDNAVGASILSSRRPISPPALNRAVSGFTQEEPALMPVMSPLKSNCGSAQNPPRDETKPTSLPLRTGSTVKMGQSISSASQQTQQLHPIHRTPKTHTPKKVDWTTDKLVLTLRKMSSQIEKDAAKLAIRLVYVSWKKDAPKPLNLSRKNWFASMEKIAQQGGKGAMKIKVKHNQSRSGKQEKRESYQAVCIKTDREHAPKYSFHHVEISKNILSPNTMLSFVPHLRDLADEEEPKYRQWLKNLENMDSQSGFATLSRQEKVFKTMQKEFATVLMLYLDTWLDELAIENCTKSTLIRYMASQTDAVTPQQKSSILNSYSDDSGSPRSAKAVRMFTNAFDEVFTDIKYGQSAVTLRDVLFLDKSVDTIVDPKKWAKETPSQVNKPVEENPTVEGFLETYALLGCLICCSHSCEHGEYGVDNERKRFSVAEVGGLESMLRKKAIQAAKTKGVDSSTVLLKARKPCGEECYLNGKPGTRARAWTDSETMLLRSLFATLIDTSIPVQCAAAVATGRPCWDVNRQLEKLQIPLPSAPSPQAIKPVKLVHWYDRSKKMLMGDWQDQTITHQHQLKDHFDPCNHEGPCTYTNCPCVQNRLMCERFCRCTGATCATKFTGCACHSLGKACLPKQKERPCICIQLNRECDPFLCGSCGARERANPRNADNDELYQTGCQNCVLQRGKAKSLVLGKSMIENCGYGLFAAQDIAQDEFVIEYVGELISQDEGVRREARRGDVFDEASNTSYLFTLLEQEGIWVDAAIYGNLSRYINHQDDADKRGLGCNVTPKILYVGGEYRIKFTSMREIKAGDELFFNYGANFPNLTKKLLDEQEEEEKVKKRRGRKAKANKGDDDLDSDRPNKKAGKSKGKKRGRKPKNKAFGKVDSDPEDMDDVADDLAEEGPLFMDIHRGRKRKRTYLEDDSEEEEEYRPEGADSDLHSAVPDRSNSRAKSSGRKSGKSGNLFSRVLNNNRSHGADSQADEGEADDGEPKSTPRRRGRKARKIVEPHEGDSAEDGSVMVVNSKLQDNGRDSDSAADEETPSRMRTRRQAARVETNGGESSPLSAPDSIDGVDYMDDLNLALQFDASHDNDHDRTNRSTSGSVYGKGGRTTLGEGLSDSSSNIIDRSRSRIRRRPARYSD